MFKSIKLLALAGFIGMVAACESNAPEEVVIIEPEPISTEPPSTGTRSVPLATGPRRPWRRPC